MPRTLDQDSIQPAGNQWSAWARHGGLRSVLDPYDVDGRNNAFVDSLQRRAIERALTLRPDMCVLDFGCGTGRMARALAPRVSHVYACDVTAEMVEQARRETDPPNVSFALTDGCTVDLPDASTDIVVTVGVLQYFVQDRETYQAVLAEFARVLKPGGTLLLLEQVSFSGLGSKSVERPATVQDYMPCGDVLRVPPRTSQPVRLADPGWFARRLQRHGITHCLCLDALLRATARMDRRRLASQSYVDWLFCFEKP